MSEEAEFSEESLRKIAAQKVSFRYSVKIHAVAYALVNIFLAIVNAIYNPVPLMLHEWWVIYPLFGWLIGLMIHATAYLLYARGTDYATRGIAIHVVAYIFTMILLLLSDYMSLGVIEWAYWPALFWGLGIIVHIIISAMVTKKGEPADKDKTSKKEKAIEKEMQKMRKRMKND